MFCDLEKSIRQDAAKTPVPGGAVHPLTRYVLNYLKYACDYGNTLDQIFQQNSKVNQPTSSSSSFEDVDMEKTPLAAQIASVMSLLDGNLAVKSTLYKDPSLRDIFLMNNGRYILQKVKGSNEIKKLMGDNWCRRRSSEVLQYHKSYQRETWGRLLQCITQEGIQVNGKVNKKVLKEKFKNFNTMFDEIHKTQSPWVVSEEQLQSELRASISAVVIPAYRSFVGRYKQHFVAGKNMDKYIKYQPEDIEAL
ncbi:exocyst complex component EXO70C1-like [Bidens hawaiensis]|uniref:exocyst complex component EXO70C1-like n=1 Tax=Bidens hawaiensis TaxID=980011 RepID=UPI00404978DD